MFELVLRLAFSLAIVLGLLTLIARVAGRRMRGSTGAPIQVLHRQALSRGSAVAVVSVGSRVLLIGATEQQVSLLTELDPEELELDEVEEVEPVERPASKPLSVALPAWLPTRRATVRAGVEEVEPVDGPASKPLSVTLPAWLPTRRATVPAANVPAATVSAATTVLAATTVPTATTVPAAGAEAGPVELVSLHEDVSLDDLLGDPDQLDHELLAGLTTPTATSRTAEDRRTRTQQAVRATNASQGILAGSALSAQTWKQAFAAATRREQDAS